MDVKYILSSILREASDMGAAGEIIAGVRLSGAVNGERGEGYILLYDDAVTLLYRRLGQRDYQGCTAPLSEWTFGNLQEKKYAYTMDVTCRGTSYQCEFTPSELESTENIIDAVTAAHADPSNTYSEKVLLMASLLTMLSEPVHREFTQSLLGKDLFKAAVKFAASHRLPDIVERSAALFDENQKRSVLLNLIEMRLSDDLWTGKESEALRELAEVWQLGDDFFEQAAGMLLLRRQLGSLFNEQD